MADVDQEGEECPKIIWCELRFLETVVSAWRLSSWSGARRKCGAPNPRTYGPTGTHRSANCEMRIFHRGSDSEWRTGVVRERYELNQSSVASGSDRLESSKARIYKQGSLEKACHHRRHSESHTELLPYVPSGRPIRSWVGFDSLAVRTKEATCDVWDESTVESDS